MNRNQEKKIVKTPLFIQTAAVLGSSALLAAALWGCGGGGSSIASGGGGGGTRGVAFGVEWPDRTRLIPNSADSIRLTIANQESAATNGASDCTDGHCVVVLDRPATSRDIGSLPIGPYTMTAEAFTDAGAGGSMLATNAESNAISVVAGAGTQNITLVMGAAAQAVDVQVRLLGLDGTLPNFPAATRIQLGNDAPVPLALTNAVEGGLVEVKATINNGAASNSTLNLRYGGGLEELSVSLNGKDLTLDALAANAKSGVVTGVGFLGVDSPNQSLKITYRDGGDRAAFETTAVAEASLTGVASFNNAPALGAFESVAGTERLDDLDIDKDSNVRALFRPLAGTAAVRNRGGIATFPVVGAPSSFNLSASAGAYTPVIAGADRYGRFATYTSGADTAGVGANAPQGFRQILPGGTFFAIAGDYRETAPLPERTGVVLMRSDNALIVTPSPDARVPASLPSAVGLLAAAYDAATAPVMNGNTNLKTLALVTASGSTLRKFVNGSEVAGVFPAQPNTIVDIAARDGYIFVLMTDNTFRIYTTSGALVEQAVLGALVEPRAIAVGRRVTGVGGGYPVAILDKDVPADPEANGFRRFTWTVN